MGDVIGLRKAQKCNESPSWSLGLLFATSSRSGEVQQQVLLWAPKPGRPLEDEPMSLTSRLPRKLASWPTPAASRWEVSELYKYVQGSGQIK